MNYHTAYLASLSDADLREYAILAQGGISELQENYPFIVSSFGGTKQEYMSWMLKFSLINQLSQSRQRGNGYWVEGPLGYPAQWKIRCNMSTPMMLDSSDDESQAMDVDETPIESLQKLSLEEIYPILRIFNTITYLLH